MVVDSSAVLAQLLGEDAAAPLSLLFASEPALSLIAPALLPFEVMATLEVKRRRGVITEIERNRLLASFSALRVTVEPAPTGGRLAAIATTAQVHGLTGYHAAFLELAARLGVPLVTLDTALAAAARREGVAVEPA